MKLIGKKVVIKNRDSWFFDEWGTVINADPVNDEYYVGIANGTDSVPVFSRNEFRVMRDPKKI